MIIYVAAFPTSSINFSIFDNNNQRVIATDYCFIDNFIPIMKELFLKYQYTEVNIIGQFDYINMLAQQLATAMPNEDFIINVEKNEKFL